MDATLAMALQVFFVTIAPRVPDPAMQKSIEKIEDVIARVAAGELAAIDGAAYIRNLAAVLSC